MKNQNLWVNAFFDKPVLPEPKHKDEVLQSAEVFFSLSHEGGIYHGWYIARPIENSTRNFCDGYCCDHCVCEDENQEIDYEYFFNANVGDELFEEDLIEFWMYKPSMDAADNKPIKDVVIREVDIDQAIRKGKTKDLAQHLEDVITQKALEHTSGNLTNAAALIGINRATMSSRHKRFIKKNVPSRKDI